MSKHLTLAELRALNRDTWFIRTYCNQSQIEEILEMDDRIEWWRGIIHDKDTLEDGSPKKDHAHVIIKFKERIKGSTVYNLFKTAKDEKGEYINTEVQECNSKTGSYNYLTHNTAKAKKEGKFIYDIEEIFGEGEIDLSEEGNSKYVKMLNEIRNGEQPFEMVMKYGMLYITNFKNFKEVVKEQERWESDQRVIKIIEEHYGKEMSREEVMELVQTRLEDLLKSCDAVR